MIYTVVHYILCCDAACLKDINIALNTKE